MTNAPSSSDGGMPKWLIIVLVLIVVFIVGCCGGIRACTWFFGKAVQTGQIAIEKAAEEGKRHLAEAATQRESDMGKQSPTVPGTDNNPAPETITGQPRPENVPARPSNGGGDQATAARLPSNFPADMPVKASMTALEPTIADKVHGSGAVTFSSTDSVDTLSAYFEKQMPGNGWTVDTDTTIAGNSIQGYSKDTRKAAITIINDQGKTKVSIIYGPK